MILYERNGKKYTINSIGEEVEVIFSGGQVVGGQSSATYSAEDTFSRTLEGCIEDLVSDFLYYDRKDDEDLGVGKINGLFESGKWTLEDAVSAFEKYLREGLAR